MIKVFYHEYDSKEEAFADAVVSGKMLLKLEYEKKSYTIRFYNKDNFINFVLANMDVNGELYLNGAFVVIDGILTEELVSRKIASLTPRYFSTLKHDDKSP